MREFEMTEMVLENTAVVAKRRGNPFATRWVRPGAVPYVFSPQADAGLFIEKLRAANWRGAIVGPHGSGKSTLLATLVPMIRQLGIGTQLISLHDGQRKLPHGTLATAFSRTVPQPGLPKTLVVIDGCEQLGWWARTRLTAMCCRRGWGLLVTMHQEPRRNYFPGFFHLPVLYRTAGDLSTLQYLVEQVLLPHGGRIQQDDVAAAFDAQRGNMREALFALYDLFEQRRRISN
jgi:hypothetical protein